MRMRWTQNGAPSANFSGILQLTFLTTESQQLTCTARKMLHHMAGFSDDTVLPAVWSTRGKFAPATPRVQSATIQCLKNIAIRAGDMP